MIAVRLPSTTARSRFTRAVAVLLLVIGLLTTSAVPAGAVPSLDENADTAAVSAWPADLQQLVNGTQAFSTAPWFTQGDCKDRGGDVAGYINTFFAREAAFRRESMKDLQQKAPDLIDDETIAEAGAEDAVFPNGNTAYNMPADTCAADLKAWTTPDDTSPWGFTWVQRPDPTSLQAMRDAPATVGGADPADATDAVDPLTVCSGDDQASYLCSRAFWVNCEVAPAADKTRCLAWNTAVQRHLNGLNHWSNQNTSLLDRVGKFLTVVGGAMVWLHGGWVISAMGWLFDKLGEVIDWAAAKGMDQLVGFAISGAVWLWGKVISFLIDQFTPNLLGGGFVDLYNLISGIMMGLAFLTWLAGLTMAWKRGRLAGSIVGAVKAVVGIQIVGIIAWMMLELANQATKALIDAYGSKVAASKFALRIAQLYSPVALIVAILLIFALIGTAIVLAFQAPAVIGHALFGTVAAAGQANQGTSHWLQKWFIRLLSLAWCKFFMVGMTLLAIDLVLPSAQNAAQSLGQQFFSVLLGLALMIMLPTTPWLLSGLMSFSVGHASRISDSIAMGMTEKLGKAAMSAATGAVTGGAGAGAEGGAVSDGLRAGSTGGGSKAALSTMAGNLANLDSAASKGMSGGGQDQSGDESGDDGAAETGGGQESGAATGGATAAGAATGGAGGAAAGSAAAAAARSTGAAGIKSSANGGAQPGAGKSAGDVASTGSGTGSAAAGTGAAAAGGKGPLDAAARGRGTPGVGASGGEEPSPLETSDDGAGDATASPGGAPGALGAASGAARSTGGSPAGQPAGGPVPTLQPASTAAAGTAAAGGGGGGGSAGALGQAGSPAASGTAAAPGALSTSGGAPGAMSPPGGGGGGGPARSSGQSVSPAASGTTAAPGAPSTSGGAAGTTASPGGGGGAPNLGAAAAPSAPASSVPAGSAVSAPPAHGGSSPSAPPVGGGSQSAPSPGPGSAPDVGPAPSSSPSTPPPPPVATPDQKSPPVTGRRPRTGNRSPRLA